MSHPLDGASRFSKCDGHLFFTDMDSPGPEAWAHMAAETSFVLEISSGKLT